MSCKRVHHTGSSMSRSNSSSNATMSEFGSIYYIKESVQRAFRLSMNPSRCVSSSNSSSNSIASSTASSNSFNEPNYRPCLRWFSNENRITVLLLTSFNGVNPLNGTDDGPSIVPNVSKKQLLDHLISIEPTPPLPGGRSIRLETTISSQKSNKYSHNSFLVLIPVSPKENTDWSKRFNGKFAADDLRYIRQRLVRLEDQTMDKLIDQLINSEKNQSSADQSIIPISRMVNISAMEHDETSSHHSSFDLIDNARKLESDSILNISKEELIYDWLNNCHEDEIDEESSEGKRSIAKKSIRSYLVFLV